MNNPTDRDLAEASRRYGHGPYPNYDDLAKQVGEYREATRGRGQFHSGYGYIPNALLEEVIQEREGRGAYPKKLNAKAARRAEAVDNLKTFFFLSCILIVLMVIWSSAAPTLSFFLIVPMAGIAKCAWDWLVSWF